MTDQQKAPMSIREYLLTLAVCAMLVYVTYFVVVPKVDPCGGPNAARIPLSCFFPE